MQTEKHLYYSFSDPFSLDDETEIQLTHIDSGVSQTSGKFVPVHYRKK